MGELTPWFWVAFWFYFIGWYWAGPLTSMVFFLSFMVLTIGYAWTPWIMGML